METVRRVNYIKMFILPALGLLLAWSVLFLNGLPFRSIHIAYFCIIWMAHIFLQQPLYYSLGKLWNPISPIKNVSVIETVLLHLISYILVILPSIAFFTRIHEIVNLSTSIQIFVVLSPISFVWVLMNNYVTTLSEHYKSADFKPWRP